MKILEINSMHPESAKIEETAEAIRGGGLVAFPTDTVYGLAVDISNENALVRLLKAKGITLPKPMPVHIAKISDVPPLVAAIPPVAEKLMRKFWPGALTIIFKASELISPLLSAGAHTIGLRLPDNQIAIEMICKCGIPVTATSANITGSSSLQNAQEIAQGALGAQIDIIIEGGQAGSGMPSTVLDITGSAPQILRRGAVSEEDILASVHSSQFTVKEKETKYNENCEATSEL